jgi:hypothetical protein
VPRPHRSPWPPGFIAARNRALGHARLTEKSFCFFFQKEVLFLMFFFEKKEPKNFCESRGSSANGRVAACVTAARVTPSGNARAGHAACRAIAG